MDQDQLEALYKCVQTRPRPEDVAEIILDVLAPPKGKVRSALELASAQSLKRLGYAYSSMARDFARPVGMGHIVNVASELFQVKPLSSTDCLESEIVEEFVRSVSGQIAKVYGRSDFKSDRLNRAQRADAGVPTGHRAYNKRFRVLTRMEARIKKLAWETRKYRLTRTGKSAFAILIPKADLLADTLTACFIAYQSARMSMRSTFTNGPQERAFDDVAASLFQACLASDTTRWDVIAYVLPDQEVLTHLTYEQKGVLLGRTWNLLIDAADFLATCHEKNNFDLQDMIVHRGDDSSTWNQAAGGWNKAREHWINLLYAMGIEDTLTAVCPGKVLRLMAADVVRGHSFRTDSQGKSLDDYLHPDTKVWRELPFPWRVVRGDDTCSRAMVEAACVKHSVKPDSWTGIRKGREPVPFKPTPELVHGVSVSSPQLAKVLRKAGVFSGYGIKGELPDFVVEYDETGAALCAMEA